MKIGILGGSFNPVHTGHVRMAIEVHEQLGLDRVELLPAKHPPHKEGDDILPFDLRMALVERAIEDMPELDVNPIENQRPGPSFTCDTLTCYRTEQPEIELSFILGASTFLELPQWRRGLEIPELASLVVVNRWEASVEVPGFIEEYWPEAREEDGLWRLPQGHTIRLLDAPRLDIKGGHIRQRWLTGRSIRYLVPPGVEAMLEERAGEIEQYWGKRTLKG
ncbi:nicotinate (nicotinamide) nucleotide adenylyltransferase [Pseudodesulfovibrio cashew]|uniref:Probable nicotinate-nucleotide adenylyltransferase n=1 Tax=Pseudodesulfovibrio cashew TaxID=2678688 RepID=A0A6I6JFW7_9BACT|nr:nicotinate (nicotinamide) nucleotide adenylyltransferase [Pseudodesulfovibrio cashew]QGY41726.1 nicotinate (nicotinamide) nucleotide adenylyltransferase [Pseudodesulfovibrio cashew]